MVQFKQRFGRTIHDTKLPSHSYCEAFEDCLHDGTIEAERLDHVVSIAEERKPVASKPEPDKTMGMHLDASLTLMTTAIQTKSESLRTFYHVRASCQHQKARSVSVLHKEHVHRLLGNNYPKTIS